MAFLAALAPIFSAIAPAAAVIGTGVSTGLAIDNAVSGGNQQPSANPSGQQPSAAQNIADAVKNRQLIGAQVANQIPNIVANTSGSLTGLSDQTFGSQSAGQPGAFGQGGLDLSKIMDFLGMGGGSSSQSPVDMMSLATGGIT